MSKRTLSFLLFVINFIEAGAIKDLPNLALILSSVSWISYVSSGFSSSNKDKIFISGGKIGCQIEIELNDLRKAIDFELQDITKED